MPTTLSNFPEAIRKHYECKLLHDKRAEWKGEYYEFDGKKYKKLEWVCDICDKEKNDPSA
jgi:hypothetical protein